jgi:Na+-transporting methylmalonyl-CoA/oxaloacetate decarboxylase gamma subunit
MTVKEKKLLIAFLFLTLLVLFINVIPAVYQSYIDASDELQQMHVKRNRYMKLLGQDEEWKRKLTIAQTQQKKAESQLFIGGDKSLIDARMQSLIKKLAKQAKLEVESIGLPEYTSTEEWLMINKEVRFHSDTNQLVELLKLFDKSKPRLHLISLDIRPNRNIIRGNFKVLGFSRLMKDG